MKVRKMNSHRVKSAGTYIRYAQGFRAESLDLIN